MPTAPLTPEQIAAIDRAMSEWRQGNVALEERWFAHIADPSQPLTELATTAEGEGPTALVGEVLGLVVVTQTCDLVRSCEDRPFFEAVPLVEVPEGVLREIERGRRPGYATVASLRDRRLVADLDRVMTLEKSIAAGWVRSAGWTTDHDARNFALALARKRARVAFPDDFVELAAKLQARLQDRHDKKSPEGEALRALREIRVTAVPAWDAQEVELFFTFIRPAEPPPPAAVNWVECLARWLDLLVPQGRFTVIGAIVVTLEGLTAREYVESDPLDLDHLSRR